MRVLMVTSSYPKFPGDATAPFIRSIAEGVAGLGHEVDLVLPHHPALDHPAGGPVRLLPFRYAPADSWSLWGYAQSLESDVSVRPRVYLLLPLVAAALRRSVAAALRETRYDVLHVHWVVPNAALLAGLARAHGVPEVVSLHGSDVFLAQKLAPAGALARRAFHEAGVTTACSQDLAHRALGLGAPEDRLRVVPYGVDAQAFAPGGAAAVRRRLGVEEGALLVLGVGRLVEKKGFRFLVEAAGGSSAFHVVLAGDGDLGGELEALGRTHGTRLTLAGRLERPAIAELLGAADVVAIPSVVDSRGNVDGLPNTLLESMAAGRPIVATRVGGIPDTVADGDGALLVPGGDAGALREALNRLAGDKALRERLGSGARSRALAEFPWSKTTARFLECYAQAAALDAH
jgi:glycosyltransferase involved in cell wall biosynthesis